MLIIIQEDDFATLESDPIPPAARVDDSGRTGIGSKFLVHFVVLCFVVMLLLLL